MTLRKAKRVCRCGHTPSLHGRYAACLAGWSGYEVVDRRSRKYTAYGYENKNGSCTCKTYEEYHHDHACSTQP